MNIEETQTPPFTVSGKEVTLPKSKEELLGEETQKELERHKKNDGQTQRAVDQLKGELQDKIDEECHHKAD
jgi:hypothetical protein